VTRNQLNTLAIALAVASVLLSIAFRGLFLVLLIPAFFLWGKGPKDEK
jgi:hypothetical protein